MYFRAGSALAQLDVCPEYTTSSFILRTRVQYDNLTGRQLCGKSEAIDERFEENP
jgi:hypothetical protein